jgi:hypothetical protein
VHGRTAIFKTHKYLKNEEKEKSHFLLFVSEKFRDEFFRVSEVTK